MGFKVAARRVFGDGGYQVRTPVGGGAATPFSPADLSGLIGWYKADTLALSDTNPVAAWADSSAAGHNLAQGTAGLRPVYNTAQQNGLPAVTFTTDDVLATSAFASPTAGATVIAALTLDNIDAYRTLLCHAAAATWTSPYARVLARLTDAAGLNRWQWIVEDAGVGGNTLTEPDPATLIWQIMGFVYDATNQKIFRGGVEVATQARAGALTSSTQAVFIGADTSLDNNFEGKLGELVYYNRGLTSLERGQVETYLQGKWGL